MRIRHKTWFFLHFGYLYILSICYKLLVQLSSLPKHKKEPKTFPHSFLTFVIINIERYNVKSECNSLRYISSSVAFAFSF